MVIRNLKRLRAYLAVRETESRLQAVIDLQRSEITEPKVILALAIERRDLSKQLARQRAEYVAQFKAPGERMTFEVA